MKLSFIWQGSSDPKIFNQWNDGLREALRIIEKEHLVQYNEPWDDIDADLLLYWEAPCTINGPNAEHYKKILNNPNKKYLLFAGGPLKKEWVDRFDHVFVESALNAKECEELGIPHSTAFGINDTIFKPEKQPIVFDGIHHATSASWKRQWLMAEALREKACLVGRSQEQDTKPFDEGRRFGSLVMDQIPQKALCSLLNASLSLVQTSEFWGGGQRATLEAMACNLPPIVMTDSPKNMEYVEEAQYGEVVPPDVGQIKAAVERIRNYTPEHREKGRAYIESKWTARHYAEALLKQINAVHSS